MPSIVSIVRDGAAQKLDVLGVTLRFLCSAEETGNKWSLMDTIIPKQAGPPSHAHPWDEAYFVISGEVEFHLGERVERIGAGDFIYAPGGTYHAFYGVSDEPARMLILDAPAHAEAFFRTVDREVRHFPEDLAKLPEIGARHELIFAPPAGAAV